MSASFNQVTLLGNITRDIEIRYTPQGTAIADVGLAINRSWKNDRGEKQEETTFVDVTLWAKLAEVAAEYCRKGGQVLISGRLQQDLWTDKQTGQKRSRLRVVAENLRMLGGKPEGNRQLKQQARVAAPPAEPVVPPAKAAAAGVGGGYDEDDNNPFDCNRA